MSKKDKDSSKKDHASTYITSVKSVRFTREESRVISNSGPSQELRNLLQSNQSIISNDKKKPQ